MSTSALLGGDFARSLVKEGKRRILTLTAIFSVVAVATLGIGIFMPKRWESSTVLIVEGDSIIKPLMEGRFVTTSIADQTVIVNELVLSRRVLREIAAFGGWGGRQSPQDEERMLARLRSRIRIDNLRQGMVRITYNDTDPRRTFEIANKLAEIYVRESTASNERESREAYEFIAKQVKEYEVKLTDAHGKVLAYYKSQNSGLPLPEENAPAVPAVPGGEKTTKISPDELAALRAEEATLTAQLGRPRTPTPAPVESAESEQQYRLRVNQSQADLDRLLSMYTDEHPDVKRARRTLAAATADLHRVEEARKARETAASMTSTLDAEVTRVAQGRLDEVQRLISAATGIRRRPTSPVRLAAAPTPPDSELKGVGQDTTLSELLRRYEATRDVYQDLLKRRENARVSMDLEIQRRDFSVRVQEPAEMPVTSTSLRLMHISAIGILLGIAVPLAVLMAIVRLDPRVRSASQIERLVKVPLLATIPYAASRAEKSGNRGLLVVVMLAGVFAVYVAVFLIKLKASS